MEVGLRSFSSLFVAIAMLVLLLTAETTTVSEAKITSQSILSEIQWCEHLEDTTNKELNHFPVHDHPSGRR